MALFLLGIIDAITVTIHNAPLQLVRVTCTISVDGRDGDDSHDRPTTAHGRVARVAPKFFFQSLLIVEDGDRVKSMLIARSVLAVPPAHAPLL